MQPFLDADLVSRFARIALGHVTREYPHKPGTVQAGPRDLRTPRAAHPIFFGSFDWHSCVHSYWLLARLLKRQPDGAQAAEITKLFDRHLTRDAVLGECATFAAPHGGGFERPYGWAWLLKLAAELAELPNPQWAEILAPLSNTIVGRFQAYLPLAQYPVRAGTHGNTAFALRLAADYDDPALTTLLQTTAERWYGSDTDCPAWDEPGGDDFLSPALVEAECMRRLHPYSFAEWFDRFMPNLQQRRPSVLFRPVIATDRSDGKIAHLDGLNLSRAWCFRALAGTLAEDDPRQELLQDAASDHLISSLPYLDTHYMGEHWLATFALLAMDETGDNEQIEATP